MHVFSFLSMTGVALLALVSRSFAVAARASIRSRKRIGIVFAVNWLKDRRVLSIDDLEYACMSRRYVMSLPRISTCVNLWLTKDSFRRRHVERIRWTRGCRRLMQQLSLTHLELLFHACLGVPGTPSPARFIDVTELVVSNADTLTTLSLFADCLVTWTDDMKLPLLTRLVVPQLAPSIAFACPALAYLEAYSNVQFVRLWQS